jgi:hypothetical protein
MATRSARSDSAKAFGSFGLKTDIAVNNPVLVRELQQASYWFLAVSSGIVSSKRNLIADARSPNRRYQTSV